MRPIPLLLLVLLTTLSTVLAAPPQGNGGRFIPPLNTDKSLLRLYKELSIELRNDAALSEQWDLIRGLENLLIGNTVRSFRRFVNHDFYQIVPSGYDKMSMDLRVLLDSLYLTHLFDEPRCRVASCSQGPEYTIELRIANLTVSDDTSIINSIRPNAAAAFFAKIMSLWAYPGIIRFDPSSKIFASFEDRKEFLYILSRLLKTRMGFVHPESLVSLLRLFPDSKGFGPVYMSTMYVYQSAELFNTGKRYIDMFLNDYAVTFGEDGAWNLTESAFYKGFWKSESIKARTLLLLECKERHIPSLKPRWEKILREIFDESAVFDRQNWNDLKIMADDTPVSFDREMKTNKHCLKSFTELLSGMLRERGPEGAKRGKSRSYSRHRSRSPGRSQTRSVRDSSGISSHHKSRTSPEARNVKEAEGKVSKAPKLKDTRTQSPELQTDHVAVQVKHETPSIHEDKSPAPLLEPKLKEEEKPSPVKQEAQSIHEDKNAAPNFEPKLKEEEKPYPFQSFESLETQLKSLQASKDNTIVEKQKIIDRIRRIQDEIHRLQDDQQRLTIEQADLKCPLGREALIELAKLKASKGLKRDYATSLKCSTEDKERYKVYKKRRITLENDLKENEQKNKEWESTLERLNVELRSFEALELVLNEKYDGLQAKIDEVPDEDLDKLLLLGSDSEGELEDGRDEVEEADLDRLLLLGSEEENDD